MRKEKSCAILGLMKAAHAPISASELNADITCARVWAARYRTDQWPEQRGGKHFRVGTLFHSMCEAYARNGTIPTENSSLGQMFLAALPYLPAPGTWTRLENRDTFTHDGVPYLVIPDWAGPDMVLDFKTTKDLNGQDKDGNTYALTTKEQKLSDPQTVMYCFLYLPNGGTFRHLYVLKHRAVLIEHEDADPETCKAPIRPNAMPADVYLTRKEIEDAFEQIVAPRAQKLYTLRNRHAKIDPLSLDPTLSSCEKYKNRKTGEGACSHLHRCFPQGKSPFQGLGEVSMAFQFKIVNESQSVVPASEPLVQAEPIKAFPWSKPALGAPREPIHPASPSMALIEATFGKHSKPATLPEQIAAAPSHTVATSLVEQLVQTATKPDLVPFIAPIAAVAHVVQPEQPLTVEALLSGNTGPTLPAGWNEVKSEFVPPTENEFVQLSARVARLEAALRALAGAL